MNIRLLIHFPELTIEISVALIPRPLSSVCIFTTPSVSSSGIFGPRLPVSTTHVRSGGGKLLSTNRVIANVPTTVRKLSPTATHRLGSIGRLPLIIAAPTTVHAAIPAHRTDIMSTHSTNSAGRMP